VFSQTVEYALRAVVALASHPDSAVPTREISERTQVPTDYLFKVLQSLARAGIVTANRGAYGGYTLTRAPSELTVLEVVNAIDPLPRICACPLGLEAHKKKLCPLHSCLDRALEKIAEVLKGATIEAIAGASSSTDPFDTLKQRRAKKARKTKIAPHTGKR
jgi:Rrf2 family transcriptional regulator, nitric oxide-sensitive transcriptional repressor